MTNVALKALFFSKIMFITTHALVGALIGEQFPNAPAWAFVLAVASHFITDIIPHGDSKLYKGYVSGSKMRRAIAYVTVDTLVALLGVLAMFNTKFIDHRAAISMGILGGVLPDMLVAICELLRVKQLRWFYKLHFFFHNLIISRKGDIPLGVGMALQIVMLALVVTHVL